MASIDSTATVNTVHSIMSMVSYISEDLYTQDALVASLRAWLASVDPAAYRSETPWRPEVVTAYSEYKRHVEEAGSARIAFKACRGMG